MLCRAPSVRILCTTCRRVLSDIRPSLREEGGLKIYYFYDYSEIDALLHSKHAMHGAHALKAIAKLSFARFPKLFDINFMLDAVPIDDKNDDGYSHTAILANALKSEFIRPLFGLLHASSKVNYSGQNLKFRQTHPRNFKLLRRPQNPVILVDDIVTTGTTLLEAKKTLEDAGCDVAFALVLADARY